MDGTLCSNYSIIYFNDFHYLMVKGSLPVNTSSNFYNVALL